MDVKSRKIRNEIDLVKVKGSMRLRLPDFKTVGT